MDTLPRPDVRVALAEPGDAFAVAALHLQHDVAAGAVPEPGFLDRFADWWLPRREYRPTWLATSAAGDPLGVLAGLVVDDRPAVGRTPRPWLHLTFLYVPPRARGTGVGASLVARAQGWAHARGVERVGVRPNGPDAGADVFVTAGFVPAPDQLVWRPTDD